MYPQKKVGTCFTWNYAVPPRALMNSFHFERAQINQDEFSRAEWFWNRRPKILCDNLTCVFCYIIDLVLLSEPSWDESSLALMERAPIAIRSGSG